MAATNKKGETAEDLAKVPAVRALLREATISAAAAPPPLLPADGAAPAATAALEIGPMPPPSAPMQQQQASGSQSQLGQQQQQQQEGEDVLSAQRQQQQQQLRAAREQQGSVPASHPDGGGSSGKRNAQRRRRHKPVAEDAENPFVTDWAAMAQPGSSTEVAAGISPEPQGPEPQNVSGAEAKPGQAVPRDCQSGASSADVGDGCSAEQRQQEASPGGYQCQRHQSVAAPVPESLPALPGSQPKKRSAENGSCEDIAARPQAVKKHKAAPKALISMPGDDEQE